VGDPAGVPLSYISPAADLGSELQILVAEELVNQQHRQL
jgi:hypothetical protein